MTFNDMRVVKARKIHECQLCGFVIPASDPYYSSSFPWDDYIHTYKAHVICDRVLRALDWDADEPTPFPSDFISEYLDQVVSASKAEVVFR